jgi:hypothetical protein
MHDKPPSEAEILKKIEHVDTGYFGIVGIEGTIDDPTSPDHGKVVSYHRFNTITYSARKIMARSLAGETDGPIATVAWGVGQADGTTTEPLRTDTALNNEIIASNIIRPVGYPAEEDSVVFSSTLPRDVGTGYTYTEVGLKSAGGLLFARFKFPGVYKFQQLRLSVNWQIRFI